MRVLGIDYGQRRIGLALSDATGLLARPWKMVPHPGTLPAAAAVLVGEIRALDAAGEPVGAVVIGLPRRLGGEPNEQTAQVQALHRMMTDRLELPVALQDERLTSHEADELLARRERDWRRRKAQIDAMAAALILQDFLDSRPRL